MKKKDEIEKGCISRADDNEPVFVLRAQDKLAPMVVRIWALFARQEGVSDPKIEEANELADEMEIWGMDNKTKIPD